MKVLRASHSKFIDFFPPPRFLEMPSVGVDMSDHNIRFAELKRKGAHFELGICGEEKIPNDVLENGYIKDKAKLITALSNIQKKYNLHFIKASLPEEKSYLFRTEIPLMDEADIRSALQFKIEENVPVSLADAVYDYRVIKQPQAGDKTIRVSVTVTHMKVVEHYLEVFRGANLVPIEFQVESQAIANAAVPFGSEGTYILIAMRGSRTILAIVSEGAVQFTSTLNIGGDSIGAAISKNLSVDQLETEKIRQGKEVRESNEMFMSLVSAATALRDEVQKLIAYWDGHSIEHGQKAGIDKIVISGADALLGLDDYLSRSLDLKIRIANPWINILEIKKEIPNLTLREALDYMPALGLALPYD